jgi:hypothetical protein
MITVLVILSILLLWLFCVHCLNICGEGKKKIYESSGIELTESLLSTEEAKYFSSNSVVEISPSNSVVEMSPGTNS